MYTALVERFRRTKGPRLKKYPLEMPLQIKSGHLWSPDAAAAARFKEQGGVEKGGEARNHPCKGTLSFAGMKIRARYWREPGGDFIEGASVKLDGSAWVASLKAKVPERVVPAPSKGPVGVNLGLKVLVALSTGKIWPNPRGNQYTDKVARWSEEIDSEQDANRKVDLARSLKRYQARFERKTRHLILTEILPTLAPHSEIVVARGLEGLQTAAQGVQCRLSKNRLGGYTSSMGEVLQQIKTRYGDRVREVEWSWISQQCSQCGHYDAKRYQRGYLREKERDHCRCPNSKCPSEGLLQHVDVNAARNALGRPAISEAAAE
jgi:transposase